MVRIFLCRIPIDLSMDAVEADTTGETEAGTTQRDVVRQGVVTISVSFSVSAAWLKRLSAYSKQDKLTVRYFDTKLLYCIIKAIPKDKRLALADNINDAKDHWMYDDKEDSYKEKVKDGFCETVWSCISDGAETGIEIGGNILGIPGKIVGAAIGSAVGSVKGVFIANFWINCT